MMDEAYLGSPSTVICGYRIIKQSHNKTKYWLEKHILILIQSVATDGNIALNQLNYRRQTGCAYADHFSDRLFLWHINSVCHLLCTLVSDLLCLLNTCGLILSYCMLIKSIGRFVSRVTSSSSLSLKNWAFPPWLWIGCGRCRPSLLKRREKTGFKRQRESTRGEGGVCERGGCKEQSKLRSWCEPPIKRKCREMGAFGQNCCCPALRGLKMKENIFKASLTILVSADQGTFLLHPGPHLLL